MSLENANVWEIDAPVDVAAFVRSLPSILPPNAGVVLENTRFATSVFDLFHRHEMPHHPRVVSGVIWPRSTQLYGSISVCEPLGDLLENHAVPEVCDHLHGFVADRVLLEWWDASCGDQWHLSGTYTKQQVEVFCEPMGCDFTWVGA